MLYLGLRETLRRGSTSDVMDELRVDPHIDELQIATIGLLRQ
jgi:hypothetical protein